MTYKHTHEYNGYHFDIVVSKSVIVNDQLWHNIDVIGIADNQYTKQYHGIPTTELNCAIAKAKHDADLFIDNYNGAKEQGIVQSILTRLGFNKV